MAAHTQGHDAKHLHEEAQDRAKDADIFAKASSEGRILLTFDLDFGEIAALTRSETMGIVVFRLRNTRKEHVIQRLTAVLPECSERLLQGAVVIIEDARFRVRKLPIRGARNES